MNDIPVPLRRPDEEIASRSPEVHPPLPNLSKLVNKIISDFESAKQARQPVTSRIIKSLYYMKNMYLPEKLMEIRNQGGSEVFIPLTNIKVRACKAWLSDIYMVDVQDMFSISPTPIPDLPDSIEQELYRQAVLESQVIIESLMNIGISNVNSVVKNKLDNLKEDYLKRLKEHADKVARNEEKRIRDQLLEGDFFNAFDAALLDISLFPTAIIKGPVPRKEKSLLSAGRKIEERIILTYNRVHPLDIYPSPSASDVDSADYIIEILHLSPKDLYNMIGIEGFNSDAIREILGTYTGGRLSVDATYDNLRANLEGKDISKGDVIDVIEYWGCVKGELLLEENIPVEDEHAYYDVAIWVVNNKIIKAILNPDPLGKKPYSIASFVKIPDSFWGLSVVDILEPIQDSVNALARAAVNNSVMSSGPLIERNIDRIASKEKSVAPFQMFDAHESAMNSAPAFRFYQLTPTAQQVILLMTTFQKMADEYSGIPSYSHGDVTVGGAGRTASGLAMLQTNASRGIKDVVKNIDRGLVESTVRRQYNYNMYYLAEYPEEIPDLSIVAKGVDTLTEKQVQAQRMLEFLQLTSNPVDMQLIGAEGRKFMLETIARNVGIDPDKVISQNLELQQLVSPILQQMKGQVSQMSSPEEEPKNPINPKAQEFRQEVM